MNRKIVHCPHCGKILPDDFRTGTQRKKVKCPVCRSERNWKDGKTKLPNLSIQRYYRK